MSGRASQYLPPRWFEYLILYAQIFYSIMGPMLGLSIDLLGIAMLAFLGGLCAMRMGSSAVALVSTIAAPLACGLSIVTIQILVHGESLLGDTLRQFVPWMTGLVVFQYLALRRGFLHRFAIVVFLIGLSTLPYLGTFIRDASRMSANGVSIGNPDDYGAWFGFCCVYFTLLGLKTHRTWLRLLSGAIVVFCLLIVGLTVSRAPLFALTVSIILAFRNVLKRGFFPLIFLVGGLWIAYELDLFQQPLARYMDRGLEETGRLMVWPLAIERILQSPFGGVGVSHIATYLPTVAVSITPHNGFIFIALSSGLVPFLFFATYWVQLFARAYRAQKASHEDAQFNLSLLVYSFLIASNLNMAFSSPWVMATLASVSGAAFVVDASRASARQLNPNRALDSAMVPARP